MNPNYAYFVQEVFGNIYSFALIMFNWQRFCNKIVDFTLVHVFYYYLKITLRYFGHSIWMCLLPCALMSSILSSSIPKKWALYSVGLYSIWMLGHSWLAEHTDTVCLSWFTRAWAHSCTACLCTLHTDRFIKHRCYFSPCFLAMVSTSSDSLYADSLLRLRLVCNVITNAAEFNQEREVWQGESGCCGVVVVRWGSFFMFGHH